MQFWHWCCLALNKAWESSLGIWSSGMIPASGAGGPEFNSRNTPELFCRSFCSGAAAQRPRLLKNPHKNRKSYPQRIAALTVLPGSATDTTWLAYIKSQQGARPALELQYSRFAKRSTIHMASITSIFQSQHFPEKVLFMHTRLLIATNIHNHSLLSKAHSK